MRIKDRLGSINFGGMVFLFVSMLLSIIFAILLFLSSRGDSEVSTLEATIPCIGMLLISFLLFIMHYSSKVRLPKLPNAGIMLFAVMPLATVGVALQSSLNTYFGMKQIIFVVFGIFAYFAFRKILSSQIIKRKSVLYTIASISLIALLVPRFIPALRTQPNLLLWIKLPLGFSIQASEFLKIVFLLLIFCITLRDKHQHQWKTLIYPATFLFLSCAILLFLKETGTIVLLGGMFAFLLIFWFRKWWVGVGLSLSVLYTVNKLATSGGYIQNRFETWRNVFADPNGDSWQMAGVIAEIEKSGLNGVGFASPDSGLAKLSSGYHIDSDLIFSFVIESFGLFVAAAILLFIVGLTFLGLRAAADSPRYGIGLAGQLALLFIMVQAIITAATSIDLLPLSGITFPFFSSGGSSIITTFMLLAFVGTPQNINNREAFNEKTTSKINIPNMAKKVVNHFNNNTIAMK